jgi:arylsulfatase A-like enzyme
MEKGKWRMKNEGLLIVAALLLFSTSVSLAQSTRKLNLLFLWTDQQRADTLQVYGQKLDIAPNLNKPARESVVFEHAYVSQPVCTPSRATLLTGLYPHTSGLTENNRTLTAQHKTLPELLNDPAYRTGYFGKWHLGDEVFAQHGFEEWAAIEDGYRDYFSVGRDKTAKSSYHDWLIKLGHEPEADGYFSRQFTNRLPLEHAKPKFLEERAIDFLERHKAEPFVLYVNFLQPHTPNTGPLDTLYQPEDIMLPANFHDPLEANEPERYKTLRQKEGLSSAAEWRAYIARYYGLVTQVDRSIGAILARLEALGLADNTIIVFASDHGDMMGSHGMLLKTVMYQEAVRVPWLMRVPALGKKQRLLRGHYSYVDMVPTLLELLGKTLPPHLQGRSLVSQIQRGTPATRDVFIEWNPVTLGNPEALSEGKKKKADKKAKNEADETIRTVITQDGWKLCLADGDKSQLFHLRTDPGETTNLFDSGKHNAVINTLKRKLQRWQRRTGDRAKL